MNNKFGKTVVGLSVVVSVLIIVFIISQENLEAFASEDAKNCRDWFAHIVAAAQLTQTTPRDPNDWYQEY